jgi:hypothetical protein
MQVNRQHSAEGGETLRDVAAPNRAGILTEALKWPWYHAKMTGSFERGSIE